MKTLDCFFVLALAFFLIEDSVGLCDSDDRKSIPCGEGVLYESEALEVNESNELSKLLTSYTEGIVSNAFPPEVLGCPDDKITVNTSMIASCLSTLDSRYLYVLVKATSSCRNKATIFEKSTWKATINMITEEIELDDLCGFR